MRLLWATDIHADHTQPEVFEHFCQLLKKQKGDALLLTGDIATAGLLTKKLVSLLDTLHIPIYFVLGNHDYYGGSIAEVREHLSLVCTLHQNLFYLTELDVISLTSHTALVGHDGWADGRAGDYTKSPILLNDYFVIEEFKGLNPDQRLKQLQKLADEAVSHAQTHIPAAFKTHEKVVFLTHVPPFEEACLYNDAPADPDWSPHFTSKLMGETLSSLMRDHPDKELLVLCGHTHHEADYRPLPNLCVRVGHAQYESPLPQEPIEITEKKR